MSVEGVVPGYPSGYTNKTVVNTSNFFPASRIVEWNSKENRYLPSKTPLVYPCTPQGDDCTAKALTPCLQAPQISKKPWYVNFLLLPGSWWVTTRKYILTPFLLAGDCHILVLSVCRASSTLSRTAFWTTSMTNAYSARHLISRRRLCKKKFSLETSGVQDLVP